MVLQGYAGRGRGALDRTPFPRTRSGETLGQHPDLRVRRVNGQPISDRRRGADDAASVISAPLVLSGFGVLFSRELGVRFRGFPRITRHRMLLTGTPPPPSGPIRAQRGALATRRTRPDPTTPAHAHPAPLARRSRPRTPTPRHSHGDPPAHAHPAPLARRSRPRTPTPRHSHGDPAPDPTTPAHSHARHGAGRAQGDHGSGGG